MDLWQGDCMELMKNIKTGSIDMILCDLPYGATRCRWDMAIPLEPLWEQYKRIIKYNGAIVLFSTQPFTSQLVMSNPKMYRYEWIWHKTQPTGFLNAKKMPLRAHENIEVFYKGPPVYNPQMTHGHKRKTSHTCYSRGLDGASIYGGEARDTKYDSTDRYPVDVQTFGTGDKVKRLHVTQKPVALLKYLIETYTRPGELVLDNCMGSGSTGVACIETGRDFTGIELNPESYLIAKERIESCERKS